MPTVPDLSIRECRAGELDRVRQVHEAAFAPTTKIYRFLDREHQESRLGEGVRLVAIMAGEIVASMQYRLDARHIHLLGLAVLPQHRRRGIGRALVEHVARLAPGLGHQTLALDTIAETGNVAIFERWGFAVVRREPAAGCVSELYPTLELVIMERSAAGGG